MALFRRIANVFFRSKVDREIEAELSAHLEMRTEDNLNAGMTAADARRDALVRFGNPAATKERVTGADAALMLSSIGSDIRYAFRQLRKNSGFAVTAIMVLALGLGASIALFAFVDAALIKPLPYREPSRLIGVFESNPIGPHFHLSYLDYLDYKRLNTVLSSLDAFDDADFLLKTPAGNVPADGGRVSDGFFRTLGVKPILGRDFVAGEDLPSAPRAVLLSYGAWQQRHGGRRNVLGQSVTLNDKPYTVVGVLPPEFHFAPVGAADYWITLHDSTAEDRGSHGLLAIARLKDGVNFKLAAANIAAIGRQLAAQYPRADEGRGGTILTLTEEIVGDMRPVLIALLAGATLLLVIACTNVASLLLVRAESRRREIAVRGALGASHIRLLRQLVTESVVLVGAGTSLGMTSAYFAMKLLMRLIPANMLEGMPYLRGLGVNGRVLAFAGLLSLLAGLLFSLAPAMRLYVSGNRLGMQADLAEGGRGAAGTLWRRLGPTLVLVELATAMVLLSGAGLLGKSFYRLLHTDIGFRPDHLAMLRILGPDAIYNTAAKNVALERMVVAKLQSVPGVRSVGICSQLPLGTGGGSSRFNIVGRPKYDPPVEVDDRRANSSYFSTLGTRLLRGRFFDDAEDSSKPAVMIVNQSLARKYFPGEDPAGKRVYFDDASKSVEIVGVVEDIKEGPLDVATKPIMYNAFNQDPDNWFFAVVRTGPSEEALLPTLTAAIHELDPSITTSGETTMRERFHDSSAASLHRASTWLVGGFAALALVLSVVGLYGVIAYSVSQRTREIGVRMALGAQRGSVYRLILKEAGSLTAIGIAVGLACSVVAATLMRSLLFGTQAWDAPTLAAVAIVLFVSASLASFLPARRAASVDPAVALRAE